MLVIGLNAAHQVIQQSHAHQGKAGLLCPARKPCLFHCSEELLPSLTKNAVNRSQCSKHRLSSDTVALIACVIAQKSLLLPSLTKNAVNRGVELAFHAGGKGQHAAVACNVYRPGCAVVGHCPPPTTPLNLYRQPSKWPKP